MSRTQEFDHTEVTKVIFLCRQLAQQNGHQYVTLEYLLLGLLQQEDVQQAFVSLAVKTEELTEKLNLFLADPISGPKGTFRGETDSFQQCVQFAVGQVMFSSRTKAMPVDLLMGLMQQNDAYATAFLQEAGLKLLDLKRYLSHGVEDERANMRAGLGEAPLRDITNREDAIKLLEKYCLNLNEQARQNKIDSLIGREDEIEQIVQVLARRTKNNAIMVGEPGTGKTSIFEGLALKIVQGSSDVPLMLQNAEVFALDVGNLVAGTRFRGDFEERMKQVLKALTFIVNPVLCIDEIHMVIGAGSGNQGSMDVANLLKPALAKGQLKCIGSTTLEEYRKHFEKDRALNRRFKKVDIFEPSVADAKKILRGLKYYYEEFHSVTYSDEALDAAVDLTHRYMRNAYLPDKAIDIMDNAGARQHVAMPDKRLIQIGLKEVELEVSKLAKIPAETVLETEKDKLARLDIDLRKEVFGQEKALTTLADAVFMARAGLRDPSKPLGSYLFSGPTGCGKTQSARQLAETLAIRLIKFDMSEYMEKHTVAKLIGAPPGYVGHGEGGAGAGLLTNAIDENPHCVLLLDEVEKAHPDIFNILLQVMDDGRLTNSNGKSIDFRNIILIMTTNAGAAEMAKAPLGFGQEIRFGEDDEAIKTMFSPEFRNRLDAIVKFERLSPDTMRLVVDKFLRQLTVLAADKQVDLDVDVEARQWLADYGLDEMFGARPLARLIADRIKKPLSRMMLFGGLEQGGKALVRLVDKDLKVSLA